jgi:aminoglycoside/choline kinase family phosphotransferase
MPVRIEVASGDASFRRYFRLYLPQCSYILMDAPPDKEDSRPFVRIAAWLHEMGVTAPRVLQQNSDAGFYLLTDLGNRQYLGQLTQQSVDRLYRDAIDALLRIQQQGQAYQQQLPPYDQKLLLTEMQLFVDWFLQRHLGIELSAGQTRQITRTFTELAASALAQPAVFVHRDYHSRNLMLLDENMDDTGSNPGILDFQDAVWGPVTYDLVSLLRDCYIQWPVELVEHWVRYHFDNLHTGLLKHTSYEQYQTWFDLMGVQRHLKATGIFARLNYRDHKPGYLPDIPRTLGYVLAVCKHTPSLAPFEVLLTDLGIPETLASMAQVHTA